MKRTSLVNALGFSASAGAGLLVFSLVAGLHYPQAIRQVLIASRYGFTLVVPVVGLAVFLAFRAKGRAGRSLAFCVVAALYAASLAGLWASGQSEPAVIGGLLPWSDASGYYMDARRVLDGLPFSIFAARRPLFPGLLAVLLWITSENLQVTLAVLVFLNAAGAFLAAWEVRRSHGPLPGTLTLVILFLFFRRFCGTTMTENLGMLLGCLGFALLWRSVRRGSLPEAIAGLFTLALGLIARAGPFLILPAIVVWLWFWVRSGKPAGGLAETGTATETGFTPFCRLLRKLRFSPWFASAGGLVVVAAAFLVNAAFGRSLGPAENGAFGNFSYSLYGMATGSIGWEGVFTDHPELAQVHEAERTRLIYRYSLEEIRRDPSRFLRAAGKMYGFFFTDLTWFGMYSYVGGENPVATSTANIGLYGLCLAAAVQWMRRRQDPWLLLLLLAFAGITLSVPFAPPAHTHKLRAYAAGIPFLAALPAAGLAAVLGWLRLGQRDDQAINGHAGETSLGLFTASLVVFTLVAPVCLRHLSRPTEVAAPLCPHGQVGMVVNYPKGSTLHLVDSVAPRSDWVPHLFYGLFRIRVHNIPATDASQEFDKLAAGVSIMNAYDLVGDQALFLVVDTIKLPSPGTRIQVCGNWSDNPEAANHHIFYAASLVPLR